MYRERAAKHVVRSLFPETEGDTAGPKEDHEGDKARNKRAEPKELPKTCGASLLNFKYDSSDE